MIAMSCCIGCQPQPPPIDPTWVKPIYLEPDTVAWLKSKPDWPAGLFKDLNKIDKHNEKVKQLTHDH